MTGTGVDHQDGTLIVKNTISVGTNRDFDIDNTPDGVVDQVNSGNNLYSTVHNGVHPGSNNQSPPASLEDLFISIVASSEDLHLEPSGHNAFNNGIDLSTSFTDDIDGQTRPTGANTWDIGADEYFDYTPDAFDFTDQTDVAVSTLVESNIVQVTGMANCTAISIDGVGSEYRICADGTCSGAPAYVSTSGTIDSGQYVQLRLTSSASSSTATVATLTVGTANVDWSVTTAADNTPDAFDFTDQTDVAVSTPVESNIVQVTGMDNGTAISMGQHIRYD